jgi:anti-anti-sigma factor
VFIFYFNLKGFSLDKEINFSITDQEGFKVVRLEGSISNSSRLEIEGLVNELTLKNHVILNMIGINIITSGGLGTLINVSVEARKRKKRVMVMGLREGLVKMIEVMGMLQYITFIETIEEGMARV